MIMERFFRCGFCSVVKFTIPKYLSHLQLTHQHQPDFQAQCVVEACRKTYKSVGALRIHLYRHHRNYVQTKTVPHEEINSEPESDSDVDQNVEDQSTIENDSEQVDLNTLLSGLQKHVALFILNLQEKHLLPKITQDTIVENLQFVLHFFQQHYNDLIKFHLDQSGFRLKDHEELDNLLSNETVFDRAFEYVKSEYRLIQFSRENLDFVEPIRYVLDVNSRGKEDSFQYVPLNDVLKVFLEKEDIFYSFQRGCEKVSNDFLEDFTDGSFFQTPPFCGDPSILRIHLYTDEFEVVNPLGAKKAIHKVTAFYFTIGNLEQKYKSQLRHIHLCLLIRHQLFQKYPHKDILRPLLLDLKELFTKGIDICVDDRHHVLKGALATISADNLSAHYLAGFTCCFNSGRVCRFCMTAYSDLKTHVNEGVQIRSSDVHKYHLTALEENNQLTKQTYGVVKECLFTELNYFDVTRQFPPDLMHDFLEGVIPIVVCKVITALHQLKIVTLNDINSELDAFKIGKNDRGNIPQTLPQSVLKQKLTGSAAQNLCLFRILPLLIGHYIPEGDTHWDIYLKCREIGDIILAPCVRKSTIPFLTLQIGEFLSSFKTVFPETLFTILFTILV